MSTTNNNRDAPARPSQHPVDFDDVLIKELISQIEGFQRHSPDGYHFGLFDKGEYIRVTIFKNLERPVDDDSFDEALRRIWGEEIFDSMRKCVVANGSTRCVTEAKYGAQTSNGGKSQRELLAEKITELSRMSKKLQNQRKIVSEKDAQLKQQKEELLQERARTAERDVVITQMLLDLAKVDQGPAQNIQDLKAGKEELVQKDTQLASKDETIHKLQTKILQLEIQADNATTQLIKKDQQITERERILLDLSTMAVKLEVQVCRHASQMTDAATQLSQKETQVAEGDQTIEALRARLLQLETAAENASQVAGAAIKAEEQTQ